MLKYDIFPNRPLLDPDKLVFARGQHQWESLEDVADDDPKYLKFLIEESGTDETTIELIVALLEERRTEAERMQPSLDFS